jgi:diguanylate cyclase (GGDEF)-like protein
MRSFGAAITTTCACAFAVLAMAGPAHAQADSALLRDALAAAQNGDDAQYEQIVEQVTASDLGLPRLVIDGLTARDADLIMLGVELVESTDRALYERADSVIELELSMLPGIGAVVESRGAAAGDFDAIRGAHEQGAALLEHMDFRRLEVPDEARAVLEILPQPGTGELGPRPVTYGSARRQLQDLLVSTQSLDDGSAAPANSSSADTSPSWLSIIAVTALAGGFVAFVSFRRRTHDRLVELAMTDGLTGLKNRRKLDTDLGRWIEGEERPTAMLMIDVDNFKTFNDMHGHAAGDDVLRRVGDAIAANVRSNDVAYRYGGEEFCVLLPDANASEAGGVAERVRRAIESIEAPYGTNVTASVGVASGPSMHLSTTSATADAALFRAKRGGRNRVAVGPSHTDSPMTSG